MVQGSFRSLLAMLIVYSHEMRMLHWKVRGVDFDTVHATMQGYYTQLAAYVDEVAELGMQVGVPPLTLSEALQLCPEESKPEDKYTSEECFLVVQRLFGQLLAEYSAINEIKPIPDDIRNVLQDHQQWVRKELHYKNRRRLL